MGTSDVEHAHQSSQKCKAFDLCIIRQIEDWSSVMSGDVNKMRMVTRRYEDELEEMNAGHASDTDAETRSANDRSSLASASRSHTGDDAVDEIARPIDSPSRSTPCLPPLQLPDDEKDFVVRHNCCSV